MFNFPNYWKLFQIYNLKKRFKKYLKIGESFSNPMLEIVRTGKEALYVNYGDVKLHILSCSHLADHLYGLLRELEESKRSKKR